MMIKRLFFPIIALGLMLGLAACSASPSGKPAASQPNPDAASSAALTVAIESRLLERNNGAIPLQGQNAPDFAYTFADGATQHLSDLRGRKVIVNFWATWCGPCEEEMPDLQRLANERSDVVVLGVNKLELVDAIIPFVQERGLTFTMIANPDGDISERYGAKNIPISYFIHSDGTIGFRHLGIMSYEMMLEQIEQLR